MNVEAIELFPVKGQKAATVIGIGLQLETAEGRRVKGGEWRGVGSYAMTQSASDRIRAADCEVKRTYEGLRTRYWWVDPTPPRLAE